MIKKYSLPILISVFVALILAAVQLMVDPPMLILERFFHGGGWLEIVIVSVYAGWVGHNMKDQSKQPVWRVRIWLVFSFVFFSQLILGLAGFDIFLMTGELHMPIPMLIIGGAVYRFEISFMPVLFLSTVIISGPAWCSQLCYFGALDAWMSKKKMKGTKKWALLNPFKISILAIILITALILRMLNVSTLYTTIIAGTFGFAGLLVILFLSGRKGKMIHCVYYCPVGTLVNYIKYLNPFRFRIDDTCTSCMRCTSVCKYDALDPEDIKNRKPGSTCTMCGDCMSVCRPGSFYYKFPGLSSRRSRNLYLAITITLHAVFLALARI